MVYHMLVINIGILVTFIPLHCVGFNALPRRISEFVESINSWNSVSSLGSSVSLVSLVMLNSNVSIRIPVYTTEALQVPESSKLTSLRLLYAPSC